MDKKTVGKKEGLAFGVIALGLLMAFMPGAAQQISDLEFVASEPFPILLGAVYVLAFLVILSGVVLLVAKFDDPDEEE